MKRKKYLNTLLVFYKNGTFKKVSLNEYRYSPKIELLLVPMKGVYDKVYIPVNPEITEEFHHGDIEITVRFNTIWFDVGLDDDENIRELHQFSKKNITNLIDFINYVHTAFRIQGYEWTRSYAQSEFPESVNILDIPQYKVVIYDKNNQIIEQVRYHTDHEITYETCDGTSTLDETIFKPCRKLKKIIPSSRKLPFGNICIELSDNTWVRDDAASEYGPPRLVYLNSTQSFYFEDTLSSKLFLDMVNSNSIKQYQFDWYTIEREEITRLMYEMEYHQKSILGVISEGNLPYYDELYFGDLLDPIDTIQMLIYFPIFVGYLQFESNIIFDAYAYSQEHTALLRFAAQTEYHKKVDMIIPASQYQGFQKFMEGLL